MTAYIIAVLLGAAAVFIAFRIAKRHDEVDKATSESQRARLVTQRRLRWFTFWFILSVAIVAALWQFTTDVMGWQGWFVIVGAIVALLVATALFWNWKPRTATFAAVIAMLVMVVAPVSTVLSAPVAKPADFGSGQDSTAVVTELESTQVEGEPIAVVSGADTITAANPATMECGMQEDGSTIPVQSWTEVITCVNDAPADVRAAYIKAADERAHLGLSWSEIQEYARLEQVNGIDTRSIVALNVGSMSDEDIRASAIEAAGEAAGSLPIVRENGVVVNSSNFNNGGERGIWNVSDGRSMVRVQLNPIITPEGEGASAQVVSYNSQGAVFVECINMREKTVAFEHKPVIQKMHVQKPKPSKTPTTPSEEPKPTPTCEPVKPGKPLPPYPCPTPTPTETPKPTPTPTPTETPKPCVTPGPEDPNPTDPCPTPKPTPTETPKPTPTPTPTETPKPTPTPTPTETPKPCVPGGHEKCEEIDRIDDTGHTQAPTVNPEEEETVEPVESSPATPSTTPGAEVPNLPANGVEPGTGTSPRPIIPAIPDDVSTPSDGTPNQGDQDPDNGGGLQPTTRQATEEPVTNVEQSTEVADETATVEPEVVEPEVVEPEVVVEEPTQQPVEQESAPDTSVVEEQVVEAPPVVEAPEVVEPEVVVEAPPVEETEDVVLEIVDNLAPAMLIPLAAAPFLWRRRNR